MSGRCYSRRARPTRNILHVLLIICEGATEKNYFDNFNKREWRSITIKTPETNTTDPVGLINYAISQKKYINPDITWCVFDGNTHSQETINKSIKKADQKINIIISVPCFEIWFLLHFNHYECCLNKDDTIELLKKYIKNYKKPQNVYKLISDKTEKAINRAIKLNDLHKNNGLSTYSINCNPSTQTFQIIEYIYKLVNL